VTSNRTPESRFQTSTRSDPRPAWLRVLGIVSIGLVVVICAAAGTVFGMFFFGSDTGRDAIRKYLLHNPATAYTPERQFPGVNTINVLVLGVDRDIDRYHRILKTNGRSDSILVARVDFARRTIHALTIPRDTAVRIPGRSGIHKINAAHSFGGPELTAETIETVFGIPTDAYVTINFDGFCKVVDAIGGVDLTVEKRLKYDDNWGGLHVNLYPGFQHLDGYKAMGYVRMRHSDSDEMRSKRQHNFLEAIRTKLKSPTTWPRLPGALDELADSLKRSPNLSVDQMLALANFARGLEAKSIEVQTLPSVEGRSYVSVKRTEAQELIRKMFFYDQLKDVYIDVPDPDVVAQMNGEYRRSSRRSRRAEHKDSPSAQSKDSGDSAGEPVGDGVTSGAGEPPAGAGSQPESQPDGGANGGTDNGQSGTGANGSTQSG
jgi:LCP family protein required for cell wall assembly